MTVKELIEILESYPPEYSVCYLDRYGDPTYLAEYEIRCSVQDEDVTIGVDDDG